MKITGVDVCGVAARIVMVLPVEKYRRPGVIIAFESLRKVDLINYAVIDITSYFLDRPQIVVFVHIASNLRNIYCFNLCGGGRRQANLLRFCQQLLQSC